MKLYQIDAFTNEIFKGNPACVCILAGNQNMSDILLQNIAMEMNLSETAFLTKEKDQYNLRWFTPETEVDFCGHATLASAHGSFIPGAVLVQKIGEEGLAFIPGIKTRR